MTVLIAGAVKYACEEGGEGEMECVSVCVCVRDCVGMWGCDCVGAEGSVWVTALNPAIKYV